MADSDVSISTTGQPSAAFNPRSVDRTGGVREPVHSLARVDGVRVNPATAEGLAAILAAIQAQRVETIWTDHTGTRFLRVDIGGAIVWTDVAGAASAGPGAGARPDNDSGSAVSRATYKATAGGTGFSTGDILDHIVVADESGDPVGNCWIDVNTGAMTPERWTATRAACLDFCDRYGAEAHRLGWTAAELFGVHPQHGTLRLEMCGALMINGRKADGVAADSVTLGNQTFRRGRPGQVFGPPIWEFAARGR